MPAARYGPAAMLGPPRRTLVHGTTLAWTELGAGTPLAPPARARRFPPDLEARRTPAGRALPRAAARSARARALRSTRRAVHPRLVRGMVHGWLDAIGVETTVRRSGHSYGGGVAQWMVLAARSRIDRLALVAPGGLGRTVNFGLRVALFPVLGRLLTQPLMHAGTHAMMRVGIGAAGAARSPRDRPLRRAKRPARDRSCVPPDRRRLHGSLGAARASLGTDPRGATRCRRSRSSGAPRDRILPIGHAYAAQKRIGGAPLYTYPDAGHFVHLEASEAFMRDALPFLDADESAVAPHHRPGAPRPLAGCARAGLKPDAAEGSAGTRREPRAVGSNDGGVRAPPADGGDGAVAPGRVAGSRAKRPPRPRTPHARPLADRFASDPVAPRLALDAVRCHRRRGRRPVPAAHRRRVPGHDPARPGASGRTRPQAPRVGRRRAARLRRLLRRDWRARRRPATGGARSSCASTGRSATRRPTPSRPTGPSRTTSTARSTRAPTACARRSSTRSSTSTTPTTTTGPRSD